MASCTPATSLIPTAMLWERCGWTCPRFLRATRRADRAHPIRLSKDLRPGVQKSTILHRKFDPSVSNGLARSEIRCKSPPCRMLTHSGLGYLYVSTLPERVEELCVRFQWSTEPSSYKSRCGLFSTAREGRTVDGS